MFPTQIGVGRHHRVSLLDQVPQPHLVGTETGLGSHVFHDGLHHGVLVHVTRGPHGGGFSCVSPHPVRCDRRTGNVVGALGEGAAVVAVRSVKVPAALRVGGQLQGQDGTVGFYPELRIILMSELQLVNLVPAAWLLAL